MPQGHDNPNLYLPSVSERPLLDITYAGAIMGLSDDAAWRAARLGQLPTITVSPRRYKVPTAKLRELLGLPVDGPGIEMGTAA